MRIGLVLGAGGVVGASWLMGALEAVESETGWEPGGADRIIGTSAGSVVGALVAGGIGPAAMNAHAAGGSLQGFVEAEQRAEALADRSTGTRLKLHRALPPLGPGSWRLGVSTLLRPHRHNPAAVLAGWLPRGFISTHPIQDLVRALVHHHWPGHPSFWAVAADYRTGRRVPFGREDAPTASVAEAVAASCAIPGFYHPVKIGGRRYVDGGICSASNLDLLRGSEVDLVLCLNPMSSVDRVPGGLPADRVAAVMRAQAGRRLGHEARKLRAEGKQVVIVQPSKEDVALMGANLMNGRRRLQVMEQARRSIALTLRRMRDERVTLPGRSRTRRRVAGTAAAVPQRRAA